MTRDRIGARGKVGGMSGDQNELSQVRQGLSVSRIMVKAVRILPSRLAPVLGLGLGAMVLL